MPIVNQTELYNQLQQSLHRNGVRYGTAPRFPEDGVAAGIAKAIQEVYGPILTELETRLESHTHSIKPPLDGEEGSINGISRTTSATN